MWAVCAAVRRFLRDSDLVVPLLAAGNQIQIRALQVNQDSLNASHWESNSSWYDPRRHDTDFVLLFSASPGSPGKPG